MKILKYGSRGPDVQLLQLALNRAGFGDLETDGIFGNVTRNAVKQFQSGNGLSADGLVGPLTHRALMPWYTGFFAHRIHRGDTLFGLARMYGTTVEAINIANPGLNALNLEIGTTVTVPLPFDVVPTAIDYTARLVSYVVRGIAARYPFTGSGELGKSVMGKPLWYMSAGSGDNIVFYNAAHHANEWITTPVLLKFFETLAKTAAYGGSIYGQNAAELLRRSSIYIAPLVNPDGVDLVTGALTEGEYYENAQRIAAGYPQFSFPAGWKANVRGVDLNLQYPAGWEQARQNKFALGIVSPAPADFVGTAPLTAPESRAVYDFTQALSPRLVLAYHTQGEVIYWKYLDYEPRNSREIAETFSALSGYAYEDTPYSSGFAGYKDWFIQDYNRPGYTIEAGLGVNPLPVSDFDKIYADNLGILIYGALVT
ncbi:MAG: M14 family metallopeptidase [Bacillota bacterium]|nr:M14 family metallopeptidase [Bacillota bacterium]